MKKSYKAILVFSAAMPVLAIAYVQASNPIQDFIHNLNQAGSANVSATSVALGSSPHSYSIVLSKPNLFKLDDSAKLVVANGTTVTTYDKAKNEYYELPETATSMKDALSRSEYSIWLAFYDGQAFGNPVQSQSLGTASIDGSSFNKVRLVLPSGNHTNAVLYLDPSTAMPTKAQLQKGDQASTTEILKVNSVTTGAALPASQFTFTPPSGAKKVDEASLMKPKWFTDLSKAESLAKQTNRYVFVDFFATWCEPCKMLQHDVLDTKQFNKLSKYFVFCRIDTDQQPTLSAQYNITALPTQDILDASGSVLDQRVGYSNPDDFYAFISKWQKKSNP